MSSQEKKKTSKTKNKIKKEERYSKQNVLYTIVSKRRKKQSKTKKEEKLSTYGGKRNCIPLGLQYFQLSNIATERTT
jgi:hypothetical protein